MYPNILTGKTFGRWTVIRETGKLNKQSMWECRCECGTVKHKVLYTHLTQGHSQSCGCLRKEVLSFKGPPHLLASSKNPLYASWLAIKAKCFNPNHPSYPSHGGRGITLHPPWVHDFKAFATHTGPRPHPKATLVRPDTSGPFDPGNLMWSRGPTQVKTDTDWI